MFSWYISILSFEPASIDLPVKGVRSSLDNSSKPLIIFGMPMDRLPIFSVTHRWLFITAFKGAFPLEDTVLARAPQVYIILFNSILYKSSVLRVTTCLYYFSQFNLISSGIRGTTCLYYFSQLNIIKIN